MRVKEMDGQRSLQIDGRNPLNPDSVFLFIPGGNFCMEFDRAILIRALAHELGTESLSTVA